jgi:hypothetical protein
MGKSTTTIVATLIERREKKKEGEVGRDFNGSR